MYKQSKFNIVVKYTDNVYILYNTATTSMIELDNEHYEYLASNSLSKLSEDELALMREQGFLKPVEEDENYFQSLLRKSAVCEKMDGIVSLTISPTTECNARCYYCYEKKRKKETMSDDVCEKLIEFIIKNVSPQKKISINWHGGEPLLAHEKITNICKSLKENGIEIESGMNTNGILFTEEIKENAVKIWNLKQVQITIDALNEQYNKIKNYVGAYEDAFSTVLKNIQLLLENGIEVFIRANFEYVNVDEVFLLLDYLHNRNISPALLRLNPLKCTI